MDNIIDFSKKRIERLAKITAKEIINKYWKSNSYPIDIFKITEEIKEFKIKYQALDTSVDKEYIKFFACISHSNGHYTLYYKKGMKTDNLKIIAAYALSYILQGIVDNSLNKTVYIDERMLTDDAPKREHEKIAIKFAQEILMPLNSIIKVLNVMANNNIEATVGNIAIYMDVLNLYLVSNRLIELKYLK